MTKPRTGLPSFAFFCRLIPLILLSMLLTDGHAWAARPLITDDANTVGKGKVQIESGLEYIRDDGDDTTMDRTTFGTQLTYGLLDDLDILLTAGYADIRVKADGTRWPASGLTDTMAEVKWRFYKGESLSLAVKPGIILPTGNYTEGIGVADQRLGAGDVRYRLYSVATQEADPFAFHLNLGYMRNCNRYDARTDIWHASFATEWKIVQTIKIVGNIGIDTNQDKGSITDPAFVLGGIIYSPAPWIELDAGLRWGLNEQGRDGSVTVGVTLHF